MSEYWTSKVIKLEGSKRGTYQREQKDQNNERDYKIILGRVIRIIAGESVYHLIKPIKQIVGCS